MSSVNGRKLLRIIHILNHTAKANGHVCAVVDLACTQAAMGHAVFVCSRGGDFDDLLISHNVRHVKIDREWKRAEMLRALWDIRRAFRAIEPDIVHAHMMKSAVLAAVLRRFMPFRMVATVHNEFQRSAILMGVADRVIAVSEPVRRSMIKRGISAARIVTVLNGTVGSPRHPDPPPAARALLHPAIAFVGGLHPRKAIADLLNAFGLVLAAHANAHLYIIGDGPMRSEYEALAASIGRSSITFCGHLDDPRPYLLGADVFVLASHADPAPLVISEARQAGCAIVATDVDGIPAMLDDGAAGILVPPRQPALLAEAILKLLDDTTFLAEMRRRSQENLARFTVKRVAEDTERVYRGLVEVALESGGTAVKVSNAI